MALDKQMAHLPLAAGVQSKVDSRALQPPYLSLAQNVQFDEVGGLQTRLPFEEMPLDIVGGGTITDPRKIVAYGDELILFTKTGLYSWSESDQGWVLKDTHLATTVTETSQYVRTDEQYSCDRAELNGVVLHAWVEQGGTTFTTRLMVAASDSATGAVIVKPIQAAGDGERPMLLALSTRVLLVYEDTAGDLAAFSIDPADVLGSLAVPTVIAAAAVYGGQHDMCRSTTTPSDALIVFRRDVTTSYSIVRANETLSSVVTTTKARTVDQTIAIASSPALDRCIVVRALSGAAEIRADVLVESTLADSTVNVLVHGSAGVTTGTEISCAFRSVADSGQHRCYIAWGLQKSSIRTTTRINFVNTAGTAGVADEFAINAFPFARAFDHEGRIYFWTAYGIQSAAIAGGKLQNVYLLYRDDGLLVAKAVQDLSGGFQIATGRMAAVQSLGDGRYVFCGEQRRRIVLTDEGRAFAARAPIDIEVAFDRDEARRVAQLGPTLYIAGGQILQYDGEALAEVGFHTSLPAPGLSARATGALTQGAYGVALSQRWDNAKGDMDRSALSIVTTGAVPTATGGLNVGHQILENTLKVGESDTVMSDRRSNATVEVWRSQVNAGDGAPLMLTTSANPATLTGVNRYIPNHLGLASVPTYEDELSDADLRAREASPENDAVLPSLAPPAAEIIAATQERILLAGVSGDRFQVRYSKLRGDGEVAAFNGLLSVDPPPDGGDTTALAFLNETLVAFKATAVYSLPGDGFDNLGQGQNYGPARVLSSDIGAVNQESVALTPKGLIFKSRKGWYVLPGWSAPTYIGEAVAAFDDDEVRAVTVVESQHQVRILTDARMLVWDYEVNQWAVWDVEDGRGACIWQGDHLVVTDTGVLAQSAAPGGVQLDIETAWIKLADLQGYQRIWELMLLAEFRSACRVRWRLKKDYDEDVYFQDKTMPVTTTVVGNRVQMRLRPAVQQCQSLKVRLTVLHESLDQAPAGEGLKLTGLGIQYGVQRTLFKRLPAAQSG